MDGRDQFGAVSELPWAPYGISQVMAVAAALMLHLHAPAITEESSQLSAGWLPHVVNNAGRGDISVGKPLAHQAMSAPTRWNTGSRGRSAAMGKWPDRSMVSSHKKSGAA